MPRRSRVAALAAVVLALGAFRGAPNENAAYAVDGLARATDSLGVDAVAGLGADPLVAVALVGPGGERWPVARPVGDPVPPPATPPAATSPSAGPAPGQRVDVGGVLGRAYASAVAGARPGCHLEVSLLAAIGQVESGSLGGRSVGADHVVRPPVLGPVLDGNGFAAIRDTDGGRLDGSGTWDRAVGPMQFIPSTWAAMGVDGDGDGRADPQNVMDSTASAAAYLCANGRDLSVPAQHDAAILSYNYSTDYLVTVTRWEAYFARYGLGSVGSVSVRVANGPATSSPTDSPGGSSTPTSPTRAWGPTGAASPRASGTATWSAPTLTTARPSPTWTWTLGPIPTPTTGPVTATITSTPTPSPTCTPSASPTPSITATSSVVMPTATSSATPMSPTPTVSGPTTATSTASPTGSPSPTTSAPPCH